MENKNNPFDDTIESLERTTKKVDEITRKQDGKETENPAEENKDNNNPTYILYDAIANSSIALLKDESVVKTFKKITESVGEESAKGLVELLVITMTQSAYHAILFYDDLLKNELDIQFNHIVENMNLLKADIDSHHEALKVFKKQLGEIQNNATLEEFQNKNNITPDPNNH